MFKTRLLIKRAQKNPRTIVFPEALESERTLRAVEIVLRRKIANVVLLGSPEEFLAKGNLLAGATIINPAKFDFFDQMVQRLVQLRAHKGVDEKQAKKLLKNKTYFAAMLVEMGFADAYLAGVEQSTANTLRPALQIIKTKEGVQTVSSCFLMSGTKKLGFGGKQGVLFVADCALNIDPTAQQLCDIVLSTCQTAKTLCNITPKVAMLSFSSKGSGKAQHPSIQKIHKAIELVKRKDKSIIIDGELQLDAALVSSVAKIKAPQSSVAGQANVLVFPDLNSGNIGYKIMQRFARLNAVGVIMQGFKKSVSDMSRGCTVDEIVLQTAVTCIQCEQ